MDYNYNYKREKLHLPEYGRHIQKMVNSLLTIEDRDERNKQAHAVIAVMGNLNTLLRDTPDYTHKLWDHLFILSDFQLDVDSPYPRPQRNEIEVTPNKMEYPKNRIPFKHYGKYVERMIKEIKKETPSESTAAAVDNIVKFMRNKSFEYNQEHPNNESIIKDIQKMSDGGISIDEESINNIRSDYKNTQNNYAQKGQKGQRGQRGQKSNNQKSGTKQRTNYQNRNFSKNNNQRKSVIR